MGTKPKLFIKNIIDLDNPNVTVTPYDDEASSNGASFVDQIRNRNNISGWATTGSSDSATCYLDVDWIDAVQVESIILIGHNFKNYTIQRWNGSGFEDFASPINPTDSAAFVTEHEVPIQNLSRIRITINSTQVADADKKLRQLIITRKLGAGQFQGWPEIKKFERNQGRRAVGTLSGKNHLRESLGGVEFQLSFKVWPYDSDFQMLQKLYFENFFSGALFWPSGGDADQFRYSLVGYRAEDIFLVKPLTEWNPTFEKNIYKNGANFQLQLVEVI